MMDLLLCFVLVLGFVVIIVSADCEGGRYSCSNTTISTTLDSGVYQCYSYKSCTHSTINVTGSGDGMRCQGAFSCKNSDSLSAYNNGRVECRGAGACFNVENIYAGNECQCDGILACANSIISCNDNTVYCRGEYSCMNSIISNVSLVMMTALHSGLNAIIINPSKVRFYSYFSGYNTSIICESGHNCDIECYGNGCYFTNFVCENSASCNVEYKTNIFLINRSDMYNNTNEYINDLNSQILNKINDKNATIYDQFEEYLPMSNMYSINSSLNMISNHEMICNNNNDAQTQILNCDSKQDCEGDLISFYENNLNVVCCSGYDGCQSATIEMYNDNDHNDSDITRLLCFGDAGCDKANITGDNALGVSSSITIIENTEVYCEGKLSCDETRLTNLDKVYCSGEDSCGYTIIKNINFLMCTGNDACYYSDISNVYIIYGASKESLQRSNITLNNFNNIYSSTIYLLSYDATKDTKIVCGLNHTCNIICGVYGSCKSLEIDCSFGKCEITCDIDINGGIENCPIIINTTQPTTFPSINPTSLTNSPTVNPRVNPSVNPSVQPTGYPSPNPSVFPTINPTINPTKAVSNRVTEEMFELGVLVSVSFVIGILISACCVACGCNIYYRIQQRQKMIDEAKKNIVRLEHYAADIVHSQSPSKQSNINYNMNSMNQFQSINSPHSQFFSYNNQQHLQSMSNWGQSPSSLAFQQMQMQPNLFGSGGVVSPSAVSMQSIQSIQSMQSMAAIGSLPAQQQISRNRDRNGEQSIVARKKGKNKKDDALIPILGNDGNVKQNIEMQQGRARGEGNGDTDYSVVNDIVQNGNIGTTTGGDTINTHDFAKLMHTQGNEKKHMVKDFDNKK